MLRNLWVAAVLIICLAGCGNVRFTKTAPGGVGAPSSNGAGQGGTPAGGITLPSGRYVDVISLDRIAFSKDVPCLNLKYRTKINLADKAALQKEVDDIWLSLRGDADKGGFTSAMISANSVQAGGGFISHNKLTHFLYRKEGGTWRHVK